MHSKEYVIITLLLLNFEHQAIEARLQVKRNLSSMQKAVALTLQDHP